MNDNLFSILIIAIVVIPAGAYAIIAFRYKRYNSASRLEIFQSYVRDRQWQLDHE